MTRQVCSCEKVQGRQLKFHSPEPGQPSMLSQWQVCRSSCYWSVNRNSDFKTINLGGGGVYLVLL